MKAKLFSAVAACALLGAVSVASAQQVIADTDLDVRAGPGPEYPIVGVIGIDREATMLGCDDVSGWCEVDGGGVVGWVDSDYLASAEADVFINEGPVAGDVYVNEGPVDGMVSGSIGGTFIDPGPSVITYIESNRYDPVYLDSEISVGAVLPSDVDMYDIPDYEYRYVYVNDQPVIVEPDTRRVVYIVR